MFPSFFFLSSFPRYHLFIFLYLYLFIIFLLDVFHLIPVIVLSFLSPSSLISFPLSLFFHYFPLYFYSSFTTFHFIWFIYFPSFLVFIVVLLLSLDCFLCILSLAFFLPAFYILLLCISILLRQRNNLTL
jgi:hypothetical protein